MKRLWVFAMLILICGCAQMLPSGKKMVNLTKLPKVKATDPKIIDGNLDTTGEMREGGGAVSYIFAEVILPEPKYVSEAKIVGKDLKDVELLVQQKNVSTLTVVERGVKRIEKLGVL